MVDACGGAPRTSTLGVVQPIKLVEEARPSPVYTLPPGCWNLHLYRPDIPGTKPRPKQKAYGGSFIARLVRSRSSATTRNTN